MTNDLEARVVQAARDAVESHVPGDNQLTPAGYAILGARAALAEIERDGVVVPTARRPTETE